MKTTLAIVLIVLFGSLVSLDSIRAQDDYKIGPDSLEQKDVPKGEIKGPMKWTSKIFPGTVRDYWIYVPAQYDKEVPACVMVVQDGLNRANGRKLPTVFDNLIHKKEMPVTIGIFITPGIVPAPHAEPTSYLHWCVRSNQNRFAFSCKTAAPT